MVPILLFTLFTTVLPAVAAVAAAIHQHQHDDTAGAAAFAARFTAQSTTGRPSPPISFLLGGAPVDLSAWAVAAHSANTTADRTQHRTVYAKAGLEVAVDTTVWIAMGGRVIQTPLSIIIL